MNYCILNGINSNTIKGLMIQSLPQINKPLVRTIIEEIDGRDGDIITKLGYSSYDKTMTIGLYGDYNINRIIKFFDSEGIVTFSNEPDKYYKYQIIEPINFERLIRFRTATVVFHVQPFKYPMNEGIVDYDPNLLKIPKWARESDGIKISVVNNAITVVGEPTNEGVEFYLPITPMLLSIGEHKWEIFTEGVGESNCKVRLIGQIPSNADSFYRTALSLQNDGYSYLVDVLEAAKTFNFIHFWVTGTVNFKMTTQVIDFSHKYIKLTNSGTYNAKPKIDIYGQGTINLSLNGVQVLIINMGMMEHIIIDVEEMNAYNGDILMNRVVSGDYSKLQLKPGENEITWTGDVRNISIQNYSRWL